MTRMLLNADLRDHSFLRHLRSIYETAPARFASPAISSLGGLGQCAMAFSTARPKKRLGGCLASSAQALE